MDRIQVIQQSIAVFVCGIIGFLPIVGLPTAIYALVVSIRIHFKFRKQWNPATAYLRAGEILAALGLMSSVLILGVILTEFVL
jgi:hypothetical protein